jgi:hypothetical protein
MTGSKTLAIDARIYPKLTFRGNSPPPPLLSLCSMAITREEMLHYLSPLASQISGTSEPTLEAKKEYETHVFALFEHWTSLQNEEALRAIKSSNGSGSSDGSGSSESYVDFMELFYALVFTSKMKLAEKIEYLFMCIDCDFDGDIEFEEVVLGIKSCEAGLARMRGDTPAPERRIYDLSR